MLKNKLLLASGNNEPILGEQSYTVNCLAKTVGVTNRHAWVGVWNTDDPEGSISPTTFFNAEIYNIVSNRGLYGDTPYTDIAFRSLPSIDNLSRIKLTRLDTNKSITSNIGKDGSLYYARSARATGNNLFDYEDSGKDVSIKITALGPEMGGG